MVALSETQTSESYLVRKYSERALLAFLDEVMMSELRKRPLSGYDAILWIHEKYGFLLSPGTVYSTIYSLERNGLIECSENGRKRTCKLTEKGKQLLDIIQRSPKLKIFRRKLLNLEFNMENQKLNVDH